MSINNYQAYNHLHKDGLRASGGVSILVRKDVPQNQISIDSDLQVIAVKVTLPHIEYIKDKCNKTLKLLIIAHTDWGADFQTLLKLYRTLIRSKIDYGCSVYGAARKSYLKTLNTVHHEGLRLILGAFRTFPVESLYSEAYEPPLKLRFTKLGLQYYSKIKSLPTNLAPDCIFNSKYQTLFNEKEKAIKTFGLRMKPILENANISIKNIHDTVQLNSPSWLLEKSEVILDLNKLSKKKTHPLIYQEKLHNIQENLPNYLHIYTDGSKDNRVWSNSKQ